MIRNVVTSRLGLGCGPLGNMFTPVTAEVADATICAALANGITYIDTAPHYGVGVSETRVGETLRGFARDAFVLSTKVGRLLEPGARRDIFADVPDLHSSFDFSADGIKRSLAASLERLGLDRVDIVYVHDPDDHLDQAIDEAFPVLQQWRAEGVVREIGAGMNDSAPLARIVREADVDRILLAGQFTLLDQTGLDELLPLCAETGTRVVAAAVFNSGILANPSDDATFFYSQAPAALIERARRMQAVCARYDVALAAAAMQFPMRHPAVDTVLVGMRSPEEVAANVAMFNLPIPPDLWAELKAEGLLPEELPTPS